MRAAKASASRVYASRAIGLSVILRLRFRPLLAEVNDGRLEIEQVSSEVVHRYCFVALDSPMLAVFGAFEGLPDLVDLVVETKAILLESACSQQKDGRHW